jgi:hypothetical protein
LEAENSRKTMDNEDLRSKYTALQDENTLLKERLARIEQQQDKVCVFVQAY